MSRAPRTTNKQESVDAYLASWQATMKFLREGRSFSGRERNRAFLNCRRSAFANVSSVSGLDFPDDGRAVATVDWDRDGDLDLWFLNRTGPRLRMMQNQTVSGEKEADTSFVAFDLQGTRSNRDAIGARVQVVLKDTRDKAALPLVQTLYAGDGYLSQSSKSLHFGLGADAGIDHVTVRWPNGDVERFSNVAANQRYLLVEGSGRIQQVSGSRVPQELAAAKQSPFKATAATRIVFSNRLPMPILRAADYDGEPLPPVATRDRPLLVNLWASWCHPCVKELTEWAERKEELQGLEILALTVDGLSDKHSGTPADARQTLEKLKFPFSHAVATEELIDKLETVQRIVLSHQPTFAVPTSFLFDREGRLATIYRGTISATELRDDLRRLDLPTADSRDQAVPFPGSWSSQPQGLLLNSVATVFKERGHLDDYERYVELHLERRNRQRQLATSDEDKARINEEFAATQFNLARTLQSYGQRPEAIEHFREGLALKPDDGIAHYHLARLLMAEKQVDEAVSHFEKALAADPKMVPARIRLGRALHSQGSTDQAIRQYQQAVNTGPNADAHFYFGVALSNKKQSVDAIKHFRKAVEIQPDHVDAHTNLGVLLAAGGELKTAVKHFGRAIELNPDHLQARMNFGGAMIASSDVPGAVEHFRKAVEIQPDLPEAHVRLAQSLLALPDESGAARHFEQAISLRPTDGASMLRLAWIRATSSDDALRDGPRAVAMAERVNAATGGSDPRALDTLAAAYAEEGEFESAVVTANKAITQLGKENPKLAAAMRKRLKAYHDRRPYRERR